MTAPPHKSAGTATSVEGSQINAVLNSVREMSPIGDIQLSILSRALVVACKSCGAAKETALQIIGDLFDEETKLVPLAHHAPLAGREAARKAAEEIAQEYREALSKELGSSAAGSPSSGVVDALAEIIESHCTQPPAPGKK